MGAGSECTGAALLGSCPARVGRNIPSAHPMEAGDLEMDENGMAPPSGRPSGRPPARPPTVSWAGRYLEDFTAGDVYRHPLGRTVMEVDAVCAQLRWARRVMEVAAGSAGAPSASTRK